MATRDPQPAPAEGRIIDWYGRKVLVVPDGTWRGRYGSRTRFAWNLTCLVQPIYELGIVAEFCQDESDNSPRDVLPMVRCRSDSRL
jgi:hypothetical protein